MHKIIKYLRYSIRGILLIIASFWFVFALLSGSEDHGGGAQGLWMNIPNTLPWLLLFVLVYIVWRWELIGGIAILVAGIFSLFFFHAFASPFILLAISIPLILLGSSLILIWKLVRVNKT